MPTYKHKIQEHKFDLSGGMSITSLDTNLTIQPVDLTVQPMEVTAKVIGDPNAPVTSRIEGNADRPIATTSDIDIKNLPHLTVEDMKDLLTPEIRVRIPNYNQLCFSFLGIEFFKVCLSGESQVISEPYVPNAYERCEVPCCEPDTRPFPGSDRPNEPAG